MSKSCCDTVRASCWGMSTRRVLLRYQGISVYRTKHAKLCQKISDSWGVFFLFRQRKVICWAYGPTAQSLLCWLPKPASFCKPRFTDHCSVCYKPLHHSVCRQSKVENSVTQVLLHLSVTPIVGQLADWRSHVGTRVRRLPGASRIVAASRLKGCTVFTNSKNSEERWD